MQNINANENKDNEESTSDWGDDLSTKKASTRRLDKIEYQYVKEDLDINDELEKELELCQTTNFNIFNIRDLSKGNEIVTVILSILFKENVFGQIPKLNYSKLKNFLVAIQSGYKDISYHNKTHGADLAQTFYMFCKTG